MKVIVTGGAGFIGSHLIERLLREGQEVVGIDDLSRGNLQNLQSSFESRNFHFVQGKLASSDFAKANIRDADLVYHLAAVNGTRYFSERPRLVIQTNFTTTENVLEASNQNGIRKIIFSSSAEVYGHPNQFPTPETAQSIFDSPEVTRWSYAVSKLCEEHLCFAYNREFGIEAICLRFFNTYGPRLLGTSYGQVMSIFIKQALGGQNLQVFGNGEQTRSFSYVSDTIEGIILSSRYKGKHPEIFNIGNEEEVSIKDLARKVIVACGREDMKIDYLPSAPGDAKRRHPSLKKAKDLLGYTPKISLDDGLKATVNWFSSTSQ
jgi:UDP-glucose 4-epimerase